MPPPVPPVRPRITILERRLQNPFGEPSQPVELKDTSRECRWFNGAVQNDHIWRAKHKGWQTVQPDELLDIDQIGGYTLDPAGCVVRGERGQEILMSMPKDWRAAIQMAKTRANIKNVGNPAAMKQEVVNAASQQMGDQLADFGDRHTGPTGAIKDSYERIRVTEDEGA